MEGIPYPIASRTDNIDNIKKLGKSSSPQTTENADFSDCNGCVLVGPELYSPPDDFTASIVLTPRVAIVR